MLFDLTGRTVPSHNLQRCNSVCDKTGGLGLAGMRGNAYSHSKSLISINRLPRPSMYVAASPWSAGLFPPCSSERVRHSK